MKIDGREVVLDEMVLVARPVTRDDMKSCSVIYMAPCCLCSRQLIVEKSNFDMIVDGLHVVCAPCALVRWPDAIVGRDPDTGRPLTMREMAGHPNKVGGYRREDIVKD